MVTVFRSRRPTPEFLAYRRLVETQEIIMASIADLTTAVSNLSGVVTKAVDALSTPAADVTRLSTADQAALDATVGAVKQAAANLTAALPTLNVASPKVG